jgi:uncharacterized repeat protein (TIGR01451 family)
MTGSWNDRPKVRTYDFSHRSIQKQIHKTEEKHALETSVHVNATAPMEEVYGKRGFMTQTQTQTKTNKTIHELHEVQQEKSIMSRKNESHTNVRNTLTTHTGRDIMSRIVLFLAVALLALVPAQVTLAAGTAAGTPINNTATATFTVGLSQFTEDGVAAPIVVDERLEVTVTWSDAGNVSVQPGDSDKPLKFTVTNTGNGAEALTLVGVSTGISGDNFDPESVSLYLDDGNGTWDETSGETAFTNDSDTSEIAADASVIVWVVNDIPGTATDSQTGISQLTAKASTAVTYSPGDVIAGAGTSGSDAVVGEANGGGNSNGATGVALGTYEVTSVAVSVVKAMSSVLDPWGTDQPVPGAIITYLITVDLTGSGTASSVVVTDPIPANTTYVEGSIDLNIDTSSGTWVDQTDADDNPTDDSDYNITNDEITVDLGSLQASDTTRGIRFSVEID